MEQYKPVGTDGTAGFVPHHNIYGTIPVMGMVFAGTGAVSDFPTRDIPMPNLTSEYQSAQN